MDDNKPPMRLIGRTRLLPPWLFNRLADFDHQFSRLLPQIAAIEERLVALEVSPRAADEQTREGVLESGDPTAAELLEAVRAEHARVRERISLAIHYEERLRALEEKLAQLDR